MDAGAIATSGYLIEVAWPLLIGDVNCTGLEQGIWDCPISNISETHTCDGRKNASVRCQYMSTVPSNCTDGDVRLVEGTTSNEGRVEVCISQVWGSACYSTEDPWEVNTTKVMCRQLGFLELGKFALNQA